MGRKRKLKQFTAFIEGDEDLRQVIFNEPVATQQVVFDLFSQLDHVYYGFFSVYSSMPSTVLWDHFLDHLSAIASRAARNRNYCEDYALMEEVEEEWGRYEIGKDKVVNLIGASHGLWYDLADPNYEEAPNPRKIWLSLYTTNPSRIVWEWWFEEKAKEAKKLLEAHKHEMLEPGVEAIFEEWGQKELGLLRPRAHTLAAMRCLVTTFEEAQRIKHKIAGPYLRLVYTITKSIAAYNQPSHFFDTFNIACTGLMRAIVRYAPSIAMAFSNFADREIRCEVYYQIRNSYNLVNLPHETWKKRRKFEDLKKEYFAQHGREPSLEDLIEVYKLDGDEVYDIYNQVMIQSPHSLDQQLFSSEEESHLATFKEKLEDPQLPEQRETEENQEVIVLSLARMSLREKKMFVMANNLCDVGQDIKPDQAELDRFFSLAAL